MKYTFNICVEIISILSAKIGISYEALNVWLFVIIQPLLILTFLILYLNARSKFRLSKKQIEIISKFNRN